jgi:hypothetical protein
VFIYKVVRKGEAVLSETGQCYICQSEWRVDDYDASQTE